MNGITAALAQFVVHTQYEDIPPSVIETQKKSILDAIGITLGAATLGDGCRSFVELAIENSNGAQGDATVIGFHQKLPAVWAAFANGAMAHSLDFGDTQMDAVIHSNASTFPAALAVAEKLGNVTGKELLTALVIGSEVACRVSLAISCNIGDFGWYPPTIYTSYGATAAVAKLLKLDEQQVIDAFSFNLCQTTCSNELIHNAQNVVRSVREAFTARNAVMSGLIAQKNVKGFDDPFEGKSGFYQSFAHGQYDRDRALDRLGDYFYAGDLYFKLWPSCAGTHPEISLIKELSAAHAIDPSKIRSVHVTVAPDCEMLVIPEAAKKAPRTSIIGKFSIPYTASVAMLRGNVTLADFLPEAFDDPDVLTLAAKFSYKINPDWAGKSGMNNAHIEITMEDGTVYEGSYLNHERREQVPDINLLVEKMRACAKFSPKPFPEQQINAIIDEIIHLEDCANILTFTKLL